MLRICASGANGMGKMFYIVEIMQQYEIYIVIYMYIVRILDSAQI